MVYKIAIPNWRPAALNRDAKHAGQVGARLKKADGEMVAFYAIQCCTPKATGKRRVSLQIVLTGQQKEADPDAYQKSLLDALVHAGLLTDDNSQGVEWGGVEYNQNGSVTAGTTIILEDV